MTIFLTGGTGLIGSHVAERLRARGDRVLALVRPTSDATHLRAVGAEPLVGDVLDAEDRLAAAMRGSDAVIHAAAVVFRGARGATRRVNVDGTVRVLRAAAAAGVPRALHISSVAVYGQVPRDRPLTEERWLEARIPRRSAYGWSKQASEEEAWRLHEAGAIRLTTLRPAVVYGERDRAATPILARLSRLPLLPLPGRGDTTMPVVYAGNVARGVLAALDRDVAVGRAYNLAQDEPVTLRELVQGFARALGRTVRVVSAPTLPLSLAARLVDRLTGALPLVPATRLRRGVGLLTSDNPYDSSRARLELGWANLTPHDVALRRTAQWWRES